MAVTVRIAQWWHRPGPLADPQLFPLKGDGPRAKRVIERWRHGGVDQKARAETARELIGERYRDWRDG